MKGGVIRGGRTPDRHPVGQETKQHYHYLQPLQYTMAPTQSTLTFALALLSSQQNARISAFSPQTTKPKLSLQYGFTNNLRSSSRSTRHQHNMLALPDLDVASSIESTTQTLSVLNNLNDNILSMDQAAAEQLAGPFFGASLFPYLAFLFFLNVPENETPKGVTVGFATCLLFVFLTIPAAIAAKVWYDVSLADSDWLHGSAESLLTVSGYIHTKKYTTYYRFLTLIFLLYVPTFSRSLYLSIIYYSGY